MLHPTMAILIMNQKWSFFISFLNLTYKPWRLFIVACGIPNIICGLVLMFFIPESPKFTFSQGEEERTLRILQKIYHRNSGFPPESFEVTSLKKDSEFGEGLSRKSNLLTFMWMQTAPLFKHPHLKNTLTACFIQFSIQSTTKGFWAFFPEIVNKVNIWIGNNHTGDHATVCEIMDLSRIEAINDNKSNSISCISNLELKTYVHIYILSLIFLVGSAISSFIINHVGKLAILLSIFFSCGTSAILITIIDDPEIVSYMYVVLLSCGLAMIVMSASTIELYPTKLRFDIF